MGWVGLSFFCGQSNIICPKVISFHVCLGIKFQVFLLVFVVLFSGCLFRVQRVGCVSEEGAQASDPIALYGRT